MMVVMIAVCLAVLAALVVVEAVAPRRSHLSTFELKRRSNGGDKAAASTARREALLQDVLTLQRIVVAVLLVAFVALSIVTFGWFFGIIIAIVVALESGAIARAPLWQKWAQKLYDQYEQSLLHFVEKYAGVLRFVRRRAPEAARYNTQLDSREELQHLVEQAGGLLSVNEKKLIVNSLAFETKKISEIMTPRGVIDSINKRELLGPLVLDDLHKTGHSRFPVIDGDIDHVVGVLHVQSLLTLDKKRSLTAEKAMEPRVFYIREDQTLAHALTAFIRTRHHLFVVVNEFRETVGVVSLEDVMEALLGRKIIDEFDAHEDLRAVAARNLQGNNHPEKYENV